MDTAEAWTGRTACALQSALRMSNPRFAKHLGVAVRTVAAWHENHATVPQSETQQILDTAYERASPTVRSRFAILSRPEPSPAEVQALRVAIAVVVRGERVLLVCRRGDSSLRWQFPAGMVKPGRPPEDVAVQETVTETAVHCSVRQHLGDRLHPDTRVIADYFLCDYLAGEATNQDVVENSAVTWVPIRDLPRFIPTEKIYPPILAALEATA